MGFLQNLLSLFGKEAYYTESGKKVRSDLKTESLGFPKNNSNSSKYRKAKSTSKIKLRDKK